MWPVEAIICGVNGSAHRVEVASFPGISTDSRTIAPGEFFIPLKGPNFDGHLFIDAAFERGGAGSLCDRKRPEVYGRAKGTVILVNDTNKALLDLARWKREETSATFIAITGSNGKTTTKELLVRLAGGLFSIVANEKNYNNQIGVAKTMLAIEGSPDYCIFEMGTNHRGEIRTLTRMVEPHISLVTNIAPSHLEGLSDLKGVAEEKLDLFRATMAGGTIFVNGDDPSLSPYRRADCTLYTFAMREPADFMLHVAADKGLDGWEIVLDLRGERFKSATRLLGLHNLYNVLAAASLASFMGVPGDSLAGMIEGFEPYKGRFRPVRSAAGYLVVDDTYNANPASMEWAIKTLASLPCRGRRIAILGDMMELGDGTDAYHRGLSRLARASNLSLILLFGAAMKAAAHEAGNGNVSVFEDKKSLIEFIRRELDPDDIVLVKGSRALGLDEIVEALI
jgi:UDP-N-acetylmuramoyl-tripeptide--D-alanyl-D-alanine ligase